MIPAHHLLAKPGSLALFISSASWPILFIHRSTRTLVSSWARLRSRSATVSSMFSTASSSCTSATSFFFSRSSSSRSRSLRDRVLRSASRERRARLSAEVWLRRRASSSSAVLRRICSCPLCRRASARSMRRRERDLVSVEGSSASCGEGVPEGGGLAGDGR